MKASNGMIVAICLVVVFVSSPLAFAVTAGQTDTFEGGTTQNWVVGILGAPHPAPPVNVPTGGPAGTDDGFLLLTALPDPIPEAPGSRLAVVNLTQWAGDYIGAGIGAVTMDVRNLGSTDLHLRLMFADPLGPRQPPNNAVFSKNAVFLPAGSGWVSIVFPITIADLTLSRGNVAAALSNTREMRIFHNPDPTFPPPHVQAETKLGVDNIQAMAIQPTAVPAMGGVGLGLLAGLMGLLSVECLRRGRMR